MTKQPVRTSGLKTLNNDWPILYRQKVAMVQSSKPNVCNDTGRNDDQNDRKESWGHDRFVFERQKRRWVQSSNP